MGSWMLKCGKGVTWGAGCYCVVKVSHGELDVKVW